MSDSPPGGGRGSQPKERQEFIGRREGKGYQTGMPIEVCNWVEEAETLIRVKKNIGLGNAAPL